ncbi:hypothetical protein BJ944DRAFT_260646 [Cunninghamella echinulata]|nr:hypothetical protein BJ944DRAFT_260646 [Cunninghamella echinulata]
MLRRLYIGLSQQRQQSRQFIKYSPIKRIVVNNNNIGINLNNNSNKRTINTTTTLLNQHNIPSTQQVTNPTTLLDQLNTLTTESANNVLSIFTRQGQWEQAQEVYDKVFRHGEYKGQKVKADINTYGLLMEAYIKGGHSEDAMEIYYTLKDYMDQHDNNTHSLVLDTPFYHRLIKSLTDTIITTSATNNNNNNNSDVSPHLGYTVEEDIPAIMNIEHDTSISLQLALQLFQDMRHKDIPTEKEIYIHLLKACGYEKDQFVLSQLHQLLRMDYHVELDQNFIYELMKTYHQVNDMGMVFELWESSSGSQQGIQKEMVHFLLKICYEKKYKHHALRIWAALPTSFNKQQDKVALTLLIQCLCETNEWDQAKSIIMSLSSSSNSDQHHPIDSDVIQLLKQYGQSNQIDQEKWVHL